MDVKARAWHVRPKAMAVQVEWMIAGI